MTWVGKKVLVTGADGFIGSHLVEALVQEGAQVRALTHYNSLGSAGWLDSIPIDVNAQIEIFPGDVRDYELVRKAVEGNAVVFHLASLIAIPYSYIAAASYVQTNIQGTLHVLEACRAFGVEKLVHTSTSETYGTAQKTPISEAHPLHGQSPYAASKIGADKLVESFYCSFKLPTVTVRPFNTYGPRQSNRAVISTILHQLLAGEDEINIGALSPTRDFNYVADTVAGFMVLAQAPAAVGRVVNVGSGREVSIGDLVELIFSLTGKRARIVTDARRLRPRASEVSRLVCDNSLARELSGWEPKVSLEEGLKRTATWITAQHYTSEKIRAMPII